MNQSEEAGLKWIITNRGLKPNEVQYDSIHPNPAFITKDGQKFAVKKVYSGKNSRTAVFYPYEREMILKDFANTTLLLVDESDKPIEVTGRALRDNSDGINGVKFKYIERNSEGRSGEIVLRLAQRNKTSRYRRVSHIPMESLMAWPEGEYNLHKSVMDGKLDFFLVLRPS